MSFKPLFYYNNIKKHLQIIFFLYFCLHNKYIQTTIMNQNQFFSSNIRNSYGYQDNSSFRPNINPKPYQPFNSSYQPDTKLANSIKIMESRVDGVQALVKQKKNSINQQQFKNSLNGQSNTFQVYEPVKYNNSFNPNNASNQPFNQQKINELRGSCPNIFKKFDQTASNLRSTTQFTNLNKYNFAANDKKEQNSQQNQIVRIMKKNSQNPYTNEQQTLNNQQNLLSSKVEPSPKLQSFNPNKSLSSGQLPSFRYNLNNNHQNNNMSANTSFTNNSLNTSFSNNLNKSGIKRDNNQSGTYSPARFTANKTPTKFSKINTDTSQKKSPQVSVKTSKTSANSNGTSDTQQKKFKSLHEIWQIKQKEKTQKKISEGIKNNTLQRSKIINGFQIGKVLGKGKFGQVFLARHQQTGFVAAIKKIVKSKVKQYKMLDQFSKQIKLHSALDHPNIVKFYGFFQQDDDIYLVIQYMNGGTLFDYLNQVYHLGVKQTIQFLRDIIEAIVYLHQKSIAHRDIKPQNIVISTEGVAKLCDFGWSAIVQTSRKTYCGTFDYAPPQILQRKSYDMSVDVWCIGVLTYQLLTGRVPFQGQKRNQIMQKIVNVDKNKIQYPIDIPKQAKDFIELLVQKDPSLRPKPTQLLKHPFFSLCPPKVKSKKLQ